MPNSSPPRSCRLAPEWRSRQRRQSRQAADDEGLRFGAEDLSAQDAGRRWGARHRHVGVPAGAENRDGRGGDAMGLAEVSDILWRERELLDVLLFKLEEEQL